MSLGVTIQPGLEILFGSFKYGMGTLRTQRQRADRTRGNGKIKGGRGKGTERNPGNGLKAGLRMRTTRKVEKPGEEHHREGVVKSAQRSKQSRKIKNKKCPLI